MKQLYAFDFDKTLVPYDSFKRYLWRMMVMRPLIVGGWVILRKIRLISRLTLKKKITNIVTKDERLQAETRQFAEQVIQDIHMPQRPQDGTVLLLTASPKIYMHYIAMAMGVELLCSDYIDGTYQEMYGARKMEFLHYYFPQTEYHYAFAVSDSPTDKCWMQEFDKYLMIDQQ